MPGMSGLETLTEMKEKELRSYDYDYKVRKNISWRRQ
jgi:hypothetical protein